MLIRKRTSDDELIMENKIWLLPDGQIQILARIYHETFMIPVVTHC